MSAEEIVACLYGINDNGDVKRVTVYQGRAVRLSGPNGSHNVHAENEKTLDGWKRETSEVWHLTNIIDIPKVLFGSNDEKQKLAKLEEIAGRRRDVLNRKR